MDIDLGIHDADSPRQSAHNPKFIVQDNDIDKVYISDDIKQFSSNPFSYGTNIAEPNTFNQKDQNNNKIKNNNKPNNQE
eukprot:CAMPEP_0116933688 /NCGR_PEP_ID=MMETSP0467-20121206/29195_1 /TAXON_ID=283647 /ORGANISM="Mesodinium pulex, Strain SPMC105" /LENGTH=78 /DNA_ID=CAMNT_0004614635 /DNA_START=142 /DNA_END=378 /DNA_ORIENTATION=+